MPSEFLHICVICEIITALNNFPRNKTTISRNFLKAAFILISSKGSTTFDRALSLAQGFEVISLKQNEITLDKTKYLSWCPNFKQYKTEAEKIVKQNEELLKKYF